MPITVKWLVPGLIIYSVFEGDVKGDLQAYDDEMVKMLDSSPESLVHAISNVNQVTSFMPLTTSMSLKCLHHPKAGWIVTVGAIHHPVMRMLTTMTLSIFKLRYREAQTLEEAYHILQERVSGLPDWSQVLVNAYAEDSKS